MEADRDYGVQLVGPLRNAKGWQTKEPAALTVYDFQIDWERQQLSFPSGKISTSWKAYQQGGKYSRDLILKRPMKRLKQHESTSPHPTGRRLTNSGQVLKAPCLKELEHSVCAAQGTEGEQKLIFRKLRQPPPSTL